MHPDSFHLRFYKTQSITVSTGFTIPSRANWTYFLQKINELINDIIDVANGLCSSGYTCGRPDAAQERIGRIYKYDILSCSNEYCMGYLCLSMDSLQFVA